MEIDSDEDKVDEGKAFELEDSSTTIEEAPNPVATDSLDSMLCQKFALSSFSQSVSSKDWCQTCVHGAYFTI